MISIVYCTREDNPSHKEHLIKTSGLDKNLEVIQIINNGESLTKAYNRGLNKAKNNIVVFLHDDITIETKQWGQKLIKLHQRNKEFGIIGVAGTKYMPSSGKWWERPNKMYGRVAHTHEGKTWLSTYSPDLGQVIEETVIVDGVFFSVDKSKIKKEFNETVEGFHFYDITFCFENYLEGVKIGVSTAIRINHKSIGATNEQWENNREKFAEHFADKLPITLKRELRKGEKLKILLCALSFDDNSEKSKLIFELAKSLIKDKHDVTICANMNGKLPMLAKHNKIGLSPIQQPPGFALGDGKWILKTNNGDIPSQPNTLYKVKEINFDVIHVFDDDIIDHFNKLFPNSVIINSVISNSLFVNTTENPLVVKTIDLKLNNEIETEKIIREYEEVL